MNLPSLDGNVPHVTTYGVHISQLIRFPKVSSHADDFNTRINVLTKKFSNKHIDIIKSKAFSKFYRQRID